MGNKTQYHGVMVGVAVGIGRVVGVGTVSRLGQGSGFMVGMVVGSVVGVGNNHNDYCMSLSSKRGNIFKVSKWEDI